MIQKKKLRKPVELRENVQNMIQTSKTITKRIKTKSEISQKLNQKDK